MNEGYLYLSEIKMEALREKCKEELDSGTAIPFLVGCIYDLFQDYILSEEQEMELYELVDPDEEYNECSEYWEDVDKNILAEVIA